MKIKHSQRIFFIAGVFILLAKTSPLQAIATEDLDQKWGSLGISVDYSAGILKVDNTFFNKLWGDTSTVENISLGVYFSADLFGLFDLYVNPAYTISGYYTGLLLSDSNSAYIYSMKMITGIRIPARNIFIQNKVPINVDLKFLIAPVFVNQFSGRFYPNRTISSEPEYMDIPEKDLRTNGYGLIMGVTMKPGFCAYNPGCELMAGFSIMQDFLQRYSLHYLIVGIRYGYDI